MIVRLKDSYCKECKKYMCTFNFNSMIVRLKDVVLRLVSASLIVFQFYDSPIKRNVRATTIYSFLISIL